MTNKLWDKVLIKKPTDPVILEGLRSKSREYSERIVEAISNGEREEDVILSGDVLKRNILHRVLRHGVVTYGSVFDSKELCEGSLLKGGLYQRREIANAIRVIRDYCRTGGKNCNYVNGSDVLERGNSSEIRSLLGTGAEHPLAAIVKQKVA